MQFVNRTFFHHFKKGVFMKTKKTSQNPETELILRRSFWKTLGKQKQLILMSLPFVLYIILFKNKRKTHVGSCLFTMSKAKIGNRLSLYHNFSLLFTFHNSIYFTNSSIQRTRRATSLILSGVFYCLKLSDKYKNTRATLRVIESFKVGWYNPTFFIKTFKITPVT